MAQKNNSTVRVDEEKLKLGCIHSEPNYGLLWFYFKRSFIDCSVEIWNNALAELNAEIKFSRKEGPLWIGSHKL